MNKKQRWLRYLPAALGLLLIALVALGVYLMRDLFEKPAQTKKQIQQISVVQPPPPPPPPPEVKPPPPPEVKEEKIEEPEPEPEPEQQAEEPPPGDQLGVDSDGGAGGDAFGLVGKKGGHGLLGGGGGNSIIWYGQQLQREVSEELQRSLKDKARHSKYSAVLHLWISPDGNVSRVELANSSGTSEIDDALRAALGGLRGRLKPPPENMPQPVKIRVRS
jgi:protein TonB